MVRRTAFKLLDWAIGQLNQLRGATDGWGSSEEIYSRISLDLINKHLDESAAGTLSVLDGGCGTGRMSIELARRGHKVTGIEIHKPSIDSLRKNAESAGVSVDTIQGDLLERLQSLTAESFDASLCMGVLYTCPEYRKILSEFARALKPGGLFFATFRPPFYFITALLRKGKIDKALEVSRTNEGILQLARTPSYYNWQTDEEVAELYDACGFDLIGRQVVGLYSGTGYDGMAAVLDVEEIERDSHRNAIHELEASTANIRGTGRFCLAVGRKR